MSNELLSIRFHSESMRNVKNELNGRSIDEDKTFSSTSVDNMNISKIISSEESNS